MMRKLLPGPALWCCPFRPFFLLTAAYAAFAIAAWAGMLAGVFPFPQTAGGPVVWHAHELLFGFAMASVAGFLLTAVPEFTGTQAVSPGVLKGLVALWLAGRATFALSGWLGPAPAALFDLGLSLALLYAVAGPLWRQPTRRHLAFFHTLAALTLAHAGFYAALLSGGDALAWLRLSTALLMILIVVALSRISMRLVNDVLEAQGGLSAPYAARPPRRNLAVFAIGLHGASEFLLPGSAVAGWLALAAGAAICHLLNDWHVGRALLQRWVLIPYGAYACMALGYLAAGAARLGGFGADSAGLHLMFVGTLGLSVLIVMAVAGRLHAGWPLDHRRWLPWTAAGLLLAALLRALAGHFALPAHAPSLLTLAAASWVIAWASYLAWSWRPLAGPRPDGGQGCDEAGAREASQRR